MRARLALAAIGRVAEARELFEKLLGLSNDLGLLAEEWDPRRKRQVGNLITFPALPAIYRPIAAPAPYLQPTSPLSPRYDATVTPATIRDVHSLGPACGRRTDGRRSGA